MSNIGKINKTKPGLAHQIRWFIDQFGCSTYLILLLTIHLCRHCCYHHFSYNFSSLQLLCEEWNGKSDTDKTFKPFYSAVNNIVQAGASSGETFRRTSVVLSQVTVMQKIGIGKKFNSLYLRERERLANP